MSCRHILLRLCLSARKWSHFLTVQLVAVYIFICSFLLTSFSAVTQPKEHDQASYLELSSITLVCTLQSVMQR